MGSQRDGHDWATELNWNEVADFKIKRLPWIMWVEVKTAQSLPTLCHPMDCSLPGSSAQGLLQARILEGVAIPFSRVTPPQGWNPGLLSQADPLLSAPPGKPTRKITCGRAPCSHRVSRVEERLKMSAPEGREKRSLLALKRRGAWANECTQSPEARKNKKMDSPSDLPWGVQFCPTPWF